MAGWEVAKELGIKLGQTFNPVCGVKAGDPVHIHDNIRFVGILAPTGTPHDRAIYIPLTTFYTLEGHDADVARMAVDEEHREISGAYLKIKRIRGGAMNPGIMDLKYNINQSPRPSWSCPTRSCRSLFNIIGWVDSALLAIAAAGDGCWRPLFLLVALVSALRERRRDLALMRSLGATRRTVFGLMLSESVVIAVFGGVLGLVLGHGIVAIGGVLHPRGDGPAVLGDVRVAGRMCCLLPAIVVLGLVVGLFPAIQAYRTGVLKNLTPVS